ncbi:MAG TPA: ABC transporter permease [Gemmatimonadaceae bacterium]|nr:ABC transporter permease [Gemmatimonadaceae bacterium]
MVRFLVRRTAQGIVIIWLVATFTFVLLRSAPGDPLSAVYGDRRLPPTVAAAYRERYCLSGSMGAQYGCWLRSLAHGDLGYSIQHQRPVASVLADALPYTLLLMGLALTASFAIGISLGLTQARRHGRIADRVIGALLLLFYSMPEFWVGIAVLLAFGYWLGLFPLSGFCDPVLCASLGPLGRAGNIAWHLVLPVLTLALASAGAIGRQQRAAALEVANQDFVRTARAKGVDESRVMRRHIFRNAIIPVITLAGLYAPALVGGAFFTERIFGWPGMGLVTVAAIHFRDYAVLSAAVIVTSLLLVIGNLAADMLVQLADPRVRAA